MECPHGSVPASCPPCRRDAQPEPTVIVTRRFTARFDGTCPGCDLPISVGQDARSVITDGHRVTYHDGCEP
jgi:hypothetical protein